MVCLWIVAAVCLLVIIAVVYESKNTKRVPLGVLNYGSWAMVTGASSGKATPIGRVQVSSLIGKKDLESALLALLHRVDSISCLLLEEKTCYCLYQRYASWSLSAGFSL